MSVLGCVCVSVSADLPLTTSGCFATCRWGYSWGGSSSWVNQLGPVDGLDRLTISRLAPGHGPFFTITDPHQVSLHGLQSNAFAGGAAATLFGDEYAQFLAEVMRQPYAQPCALADAVLVLLHQSDGVIRGAFEEDIALWHKQLDATAEHRYFEVWSRLHLAAVEDQLPSASAAALPATCATSTIEQLEQLCHAAGLRPAGTAAQPAGRDGALPLGVCVQGSVSPVCVEAPEATECAPRTPGLGAVDCSTAALGAITDEHCPLSAAATGGGDHDFVPTACPLGCAAPFVGWWAQCGSNPDLGAFDRLVDGQLTAFSATCIEALLGCGWTPGGGGPGGGH